MMLNTVTVEDIRAKIRETSELIAAQTGSFS